MTQEDKQLLLKDLGARKTEHIPIIKPIKDYRGFIITEEQYVEEPHPQYNYLGFKAENDVGQHVEVIFHDIDMRIKTHDELLDIFLKRVDQFINDIGDIIQRDKTLTEAQKSINILSQRNDDIRNSYEESLKEKNKYIEILSFKIAELENQLNNTNNGNTIHNSNARSNP